MNQGDRSARWSARVDPPEPVSTGQRAARFDSAPESRDTSALSDTRSERQRRVSRRQLDQLARDLSERDRAILSSLADYGLLQTGHLQRLHFRDHASEVAAARICRRVLKRLSDARLIEPIERRIGGIRAGSAGTVWRLGPAGDRLLRAGDPEARRARRREPSLRFLEHRLLVADVAVELTTLAIAAVIDLLQLHPEPRSWRTYGGLHGAREVLKPDLFAVTAVGDYEDHWFIEVDRGTESLPTLLKQCRQYETYRRTGREQDDSGVFPRVLWLVPDGRRCGRLEAALQYERDLNHRLFRVAVYHELRAVISGGAS